MATKTITITTSAYARLKGAKRENESFSQAIERVIRRPLSAAEYRKWMADLAEHPASDSFIETVEDVVAQRRHPINMVQHYAMLKHNGVDRSKKTAGKRRKATHRS